MHDKFRFIQDAYAAYERQEITNGNVPRNISCINPDIAEWVKTKFLMKKQIQTSYNLTREEAKELCSWMNPQVYIRDKTKICHYSVEEIEEKVAVLYDKRTNVILKCEAAKMLGVSVDTIPSLVNAGFLQEVKFMKKIYLCKKTLNNLQKGFDAKSLTSDANCVSWGRLFDKYRTSGLCVVDLIYLLSSRKIAAYSLFQSNKVSDFYFMPGDVEKIILYITERTINKRGYCLGQAAKAISVGERTVHKLIELGLLNPIKAAANNNRRKEYFFNIEEIEAFHRKYITPKEAEKVYGKSQNYFRNLVFRGKVDNVLSGTCSKVLLNRREVMEYMRLKR
ncbi:hypothetical protein JOC77_002789 [Peribacillus deserti]|uniref:Helix-turn-helix domain-containing protein n=1 Tax=Peribacillus deserti TaxID=673318 RepID=A0ABS2QKW0_9BACI|nr:helix-turn-helix domain-containing protein [Peribacillus deserti]MBM7693349.1 hypothetical protein [Peribacillus deserti]